MQHLDEGTIHALLDGELAGNEGTEILAHIESCEACSSRLAEERLIQSEADRMILELDAPAPSATAGSALPFSTDEPFVLPPPPPGQAVRQGAPVVLVPDRDSDRPRIPLRYLGWAAMLAVAAGAGYFASQVGRRGPPPGASVMSDAPITITLPPMESTGADSGLAQYQAQDSARVDSTPLAAVGQNEALRDSPPAVALTDSPAGKTSAARDLAAEAAPRTPPREVDSEAARRQEQRTAREREAEPPAREDVAAAEAQSAPAAAAALPRPTPIRPEQTRAMAMDQQAQITMRVGLDEAQRMLGGPVHVIDGMRPEFMGLVEGRLVPGADPNSYVVRVVYLDDNRRQLYLDQQRLDQSRRLTGAARDTIPPDWVKGDVRLSLKGSLGAAELRALAERVR